MFDNLSPARLWFLLQQIYRTHDLARLTVSALRHALGKPSALDRVRSTGESPSIVVTARPSTSALLRNYGVPLANQTANGDSGRAGQAFNGPAYAGVSNATYGTLTAGRQQTLQFDAVNIYDPQGGAYAFGLLGYASSFNRAGDTEASRWDNSVKYVYQYGPVHAAVQYSDGGADTGIFGGAYGFNGRRLSWVLARRGLSKRESSCFRIRGQCKLVWTGNVDDA
jgi:hypothetical protein